MGLPRRTIEYMGVYIGGGGAHVGNLSLNIFYTVLELGEFRAWLGVQGRGFWVLGLGLRTCV